MPESDFFLIIQWLLMIFLLGTIFLPTTFYLLDNLYSRGYIFSKIIGILFLSYVVFLLGTIKVLSFNNFALYFVILLGIILNVYIFQKTSFLEKFRGKIKFFLLEEVIFILSFFFWSYIRAHQPEIHGIEKFMDQAFINSILRASFFPPLDPWLTPLSINYYYFGHFITAVLTKLSNLPSYFTYNLMLSTIFSLTFTGAFSVGINIFNLNNDENDLKSKKLRKIKTFLTGLLTAFLVTLAGNLQTIYSFFTQYKENPVPFWQLTFSPQTFPNSYWYPNATRFIPNTIHELPSYALVLSDLHGHLIDTPFTLLGITVLLSVFLALIKNKTISLKILLPYLLIFGFLLSIMNMVNTLDGVIYLILAAIVFFVLFIKNTSNLKSSINNLVLITAALIILLIVFSLPFSLFVKPFVSGIGVLCAPKFLTNIGSLGPFLFESDHCQRSPLWQLYILYGAFYYFAIPFIFLIIKKLKAKPEARNLNPIDLFILILIATPIIFIMIPEFIYLKDIYPGHYRANTMFKFAYQSFIFLSIASSYILIKIFPILKRHIFNLSLKTVPFFIYLIFALLQLGLMSLYPYFAINSYYGNLQTYYGLNGISYLKNLYPEDYDAIMWINKNIKGQPVILESQGDSYSDHSRISANTGLPTILGWTVHEWLWRGSYDVPAPRIEEVRLIYESGDIEQTRSLLKKYNVEYVYLGNLEREKYKEIKEAKFKGLGNVIFETGNTKIYKLNSD